MTTVQTKLVFEENLEGTAMSVKNAIGFELGCIEKRAGEEIWAFKPARNNAVSLSLELQAIGTLQRVKDAVVVIQEYKRLQELTKELSPGQRIEAIVMAHRYLYYVLNESILHDLAYDVIERRARAMARLKSSPIQKVGSSIESDYTQYQKDYAVFILYCHTHNFSNIEF